MLETFPGKKFLNILNLIYTDFKLHGIHSNQEKKMHVVAENLSRFFILQIKLPVDLLQFDHIDLGIYDQKITNPSQSGPNKKLYLTIRSESF
jgi:hypothetical protein